jgi:chaperone modulatory protein CbpM
MNPQFNPLAAGACIAEEIHLSLVELCRACHAPEAHVIAWVYEGVLDPVGAAPQEWRFTGASLRRAKLALWLSRDLEINPPGIAMVLDLLDDLAALQARLERSKA